MSAQRVKSTSVAPRDKSDVLDRVAIFSELSPETRRRLGTYAKIKRYAQGVVIFEKGSAGTCLFVVRKGIVKVSVPSAERCDAVFTLLAEGELLGEISLLDGGTRTADAQAFTECELMIIDRRDFAPLLRTEPDLSLKIIEVLCARLRRTTEQVEDLMFLDLKGRLIKMLLRLSASADPPGTIPMSQRELAQIVGLSREEINKQLRIWAKTGCLRLERRSITVLHPEVLSDVFAAGR